MHKKLIAAAAVAIVAAGASFSAGAQEVIRLGNLKFAHYGAVSYIKEIAPKCGIKVDEKVFAKGPDVMQGILAGELDVGTTASEAAISGRANGAPIYVVAGFAKGGARLVAAKDSGIKSVKDLKGKKVGVTRGGIHEVLLDAELPLGDGRGLTVAYHAACSLQHGQKVTDAPKRLLAGAGYAVRTPIEAHLCCGSAGTYNILQPEIAGKLGDRKAENLGRLQADVIATGNIGCAMQLAPRLGVPVVHTIELLDWATGGPVPPQLAGREALKGG